MYRQAISATDCSLAQVAMRYAFGMAFICEDEHAARKVMESPDVRARGVSLQGDDYNPAGTMTGGSRGDRAPVLTRLHEIAKIEEQLERHEARCPLH
jgi:structural maintenance of chromosome 2